MKLCTERLARQYGDGWAVRGIDPQLTEGIHGLLGPNGAGKSTLMRPHTTIAPPTERTPYGNHIDITDDSGAVQSGLGYHSQDFSRRTDITRGVATNPTPGLASTDGERSHPILTEPGEGWKP